MDPDALAYGDVVHRALAEAADGGGAPAAAVGWAAEQAARILDHVGVWELSPRQDRQELEAAACACRAAGWWAVPYPVGERLARRPGGPADGLAVVAGPVPAAPIGGTALTWELATVDGRATVLEPSTVAAATGPDGRTVTFAAGVDDLFAGAAGDGAAGGDVALALVLPCFVLLGTLDRAVALTREHVAARRQFGQPLASFQAVQFQLADAEVERVGADAVTRYALWSIAEDRPDAVADALACRLAVVQAAGAVLRTAHQLHGATGFCRETALAAVSAASVPGRRLPFGAAATAALLDATTGPAGLDDPFRAVRR